MAPVSQELEPPAIPARFTLTLRAVFRLALRQTEGLIGSVLQLLSLDLPVPDYSTLSRRAQTLELPAQPRGLAARSTCWLTVQD